MSEGPIRKKPTPFRSSMKKQTWEKEQIYVRRSDTEEADTFPIVAIEHNLPKQWMELS